MRHLSLFTGIGGFDLAGDRAGIGTVGQVEIDKSCRSVLERWWPQVPRWEDVTDVGSANLPDFDVLTGGFPCQDISLAGKRAGLAGERSGLWYEFARIIAECRPRWVVIENVPGLLSSNRGRDMGTILGTLGDYGYGWAYRVLDAQWFGVAQRRRRVFIVGHLGGTGATQVLAVGQGGAGDIAPSRETGQGVASAVEGSPDESSAGTLGSVRGGYRTTDLDNNGAWVIRRGWTEASHEAWREGDPMGAIDTGGGGSSRHLSALVSEHTAVRLSMNEPAPDLAYEYGDLRPSPTLRRLTPTECARLQGFPDDWNDHLSDTQRYRQFGNAVAVPVVEWLMRRLVTVDDGAARLYA